MSERRPEWFPVARWEATRTLGRKDFVISVLLLPVMMGGFALLSGWFKERERSRDHRVAAIVHDPTGQVRTEPLAALKGFVWVVPPEEERTTEALTLAVRTRRLDGAVLLRPGFAQDTSAQLIVRRSAPGWKRRLEQHVREEVRRERAGLLGLDPAALGRLDAPMRLAEIVAVPQGKVSLVDRVAGGLLALLLVASLFVTTSYMAIGITGEKQARVTEVVVSAIRPQAWIDGKIVAFTLIGIVQAVLWVGSLALLPLFFPVPLPSGINVGMLCSSAALFVLGLVLYVSLFALILATIKDLQSTSKAQAYLYFLPFIPFTFLEAVLENPDAPWCVIVSQVPFFSPFLMPARMAVSGVAGWEVVLALALLAVTAYLLRRAAGVAFRVAMLMYGKELSLPELVRWAKQA